MNKIKWLILLSLTLIRALTIQYSYSDEMVYANMGRAIMQGYIPYQDFFCAHPPLMIYFVALFSYNLLTLRLFLLGIQVLIIIFFYKILEEMQVPEMNQHLLTILLIISAGFFHVFNLYMGFGLMTLLIMISYYYYLKGNHYVSIFVASIALLTRLYAVFYIIPMTIISWKELKVGYLFAIIPLMLVTIAQPFMLESVFLYHVDSGTGKGFMDDTERYWVLESFFFMYAFYIIFALLKRDWNTSLISAFIFLGIFNLKSVYMMYTSLLAVWLILAGASKLSKKYLVLLIPLASISLINYQFYAIRETIIFSEVNRMVYHAGQYGLPVTGNLNFMNLVSWAGNIPLVNSSLEPAGIIDTTFARIMHVAKDYWLPVIANQSHLFMCFEHWEGIYSPCDLINRGDYEEVYRYRNVAMLVKW